VENPGISVLDPERVREERAKAGIPTDHELARRMGVRPATVSDALNGHAVSLDFICRLFVALSTARPVR